MTDKPHFKRVYLAIRGIYAWAVFTHRHSRSPVIVCIDLSCAQEMAREKFDPKNFRNQTVSKRLLDA